MPPDMGFKADGSGDTPGGTNHVCDKPFLAAVLACNHHRLRHAPVSHQRGLDLARLDPEPAQLHLMVRAPDELQHPVGAPPRQVPGPVHPAATAERVGDKPLRRQSRTTHIAARQTNPRNVKLPDHTGRNRREIVIQHIGTVVRQRPTNRNARPERIRRTVAMGRGPDTALGRPVFVDEGHARKGLVVLDRQLRWTVLAGDNDRR